MRPQHRCGYTLVELLLVIAIIALLSALLFAVFAPARRKSHEASCLSNLRQIGLAFKMYESDYGDLPETLPDLTKSYVNDQRILWCPQSLANAKANLSDLPRTQQLFGGRVSSYWYNRELADRMQVQMPPDKDEPHDYRVSWAEARRSRGELLPVLECQAHDLYRSNVQLALEKGVTKIILRLDGSAKRTTARLKPEARRMEYWWEL